MNERQIKDYFALLEHADLDKLSERETDETVMTFLEKVDVDKLSKSVDGEISKVIKYFENIVDVTEIEEAKIEWLKLCLLKHKLDKL
ncbi:hypothetical protein PVK64_09425 [Aliivibrio sp. S4TY2]|uniref:hypothetical protein n=1 Tax=unclassified Aliivibrio TaxID=2645654 RepID=UPI002378672B|nr:MULTISPECIES: hypothetical protein [unclassified Aliivibrio]MDD9156407.1 hypothetical protein [Aliivibrio sp. S4TY2]MDD9162337.1 hypothetical protein [Aliivibrio sp. S4TY1]MDD9164115.1 hypothetical protein [Aliivibrio sp. S4MY2]MDD9167912.1 hypothetical protein [Aliivibrio sp. S4MY4]MDD9187423.1 hypothetical protein [Aliivibrio sp. S4MY3]